MTHERGSAGMLCLPPPAVSGSAVAEAYTAFKLADYYGEPIPNLVFRLKDGGRVAKAYHWLGEVAYDPGEGVRLVFPDAVFTLRGRNLLPVFTAVAAHAAQWVWEADRADVFLADGGMCVIEKIERGSGRA